MANANACPTAEAIPDELLLDILTRLPDPLDLLRCAATCTRWLRVLGNDRAILRRAELLPKKENARHATFVLGAFYQNVSLVCAPEAREKKSDCPPQFGRLHASSRRLRPGCTSSFIPNVDGLFNYAKPLASHRGLLLARLLPRPLDLGKLHLAVCQPLTGNAHLLPSPAAGLAHDRLGRDVTGYALLTGPMPTFRVLCTTVCSNSRLAAAYSYSSAIGAWSAPMECPEVVGGLTVSGPPAGVVDGHGTVHWLYRDQTSFYTLDVSADATRVSLTKIPIAVPVNSPWQLEQPPFLCIAGGGKLSFVNKIDYGSTLELWTKQGDDHGLDCWMSRKLTAHEPCRVLGFAESRGALLIHRRDGLFSLDLERQELEQIRGREGIMDWYPGELCIRCGCPEFDSCQWCMFNHRVLYEMDWSSYILHLLCGGLGGSTTTT
ncbi:hypothetical protein VPH35_107419 [Triticum aestivum]